MDYFADVDHIVGPFYEQLGSLSHMERAHASTPPITTTPQLRRTKSCDARAHLAQTWRYSASMMSERCRGKRWREKSLIGSTPSRNAPPYTSPHRRSSRRISSAISANLFDKLTRGMVIQFLNFTESVTMTKRSAEKIFKLLDIYETLRDNSTVIDNLFPEESAAALKTEATTTRGRMGEAAICNFCNLENSIKSDTGKTTVLGGAISA